MSVFPHGPRPTVPTGVYRTVVLVLVRDALSVARRLAFWLQPRLLLQHGDTALASDLMEGFRQILVDGYVLLLVNNSWIRPEDFEQTKVSVSRKMPLTGS